MGCKEEEPPEQQKPGLEKHLLSSSVPKAQAESRELGVHQAVSSVGMGRAQESPWGAHILVPPTRERETSCGQGRWAGGSASRVLRWEESLGSPGSPRGPPDGEALGSEPRKER